MNQQDFDEKYLHLLLDKIAICKTYRPRFGQGSPVSSKQFQTIYQADPFYTWIGLDHPMLYAAHRAAGGLTSLYRQIGIACEQLFRQILMDYLALTEDQVVWSYTLTSPGQAVNRHLSLDARLRWNDLRDRDQQRLRDWLVRIVNEMGINEAIAGALQGVVFEVRQGYKSKDSKRQNADLISAGMAYTQAYLPVIVLFSTQIDHDVARRYTSAGWLLLTGTLSDNPVTSVFAFSRQILGFDLAGFFMRNSLAIRDGVEAVLQVLLSAEDMHLSDNQHLDTEFDQTGAGEDE